MKRIIAIILIIAATLCGCYIAWQHFNQQNQEIVQAQVEEQAQIEAETVDIVVAATDIEENTQIREEMLKTIPVSKSEQELYKAMTSTYAVVGKVANKSIVTGSFILEADIEDLDLAAKHASMSYNVPEGMYAIPVSISNLTASGGYIEEGDTVDILVSAVDLSFAQDPTLYEKSITDSQFAAYCNANLSLTELAEDIQVLALGSKGETVYDEEGNYVGVSTLILAMDEQTSSDFFELEELGSPVYLRLRHRGDDASTTEQMLQLAGVNSTAETDAVMQSAQNSTANTSATSTASYDYSNSTSAAATPAPVSINGDDVVSTDQ